MPGTCDRNVLCSSLRHRFGPDCGQESEIAAVDAEIPVEIDDGVVVRIAEPAPERPRQKEVVRSVDAARRAAGPDEVRVHARILAGVADAVAIAVLLRGV